LPYVAHETARRSTIMTALEPRYGAIEAGGTKFICAIGTQTGRILDDCRIATRDPATTLGEVQHYFQSAQAQLGPLQGIGIGAFGPLQVNPRSARFGCLTSTPKPGWSNIDLLEPLRRGLERPLCLDTDVNAAALGEWRWGAGQGLESLAYVTVGTGIGAGVVHHGRPIHGLMHPEFGHIRVQRHPADPEFAGVCPFHGDCLEGLISGPAILARTGLTLADLSTTHLVWDFAADYLGQLSALLVLTHSPERIVFGGGVMQQRLLKGISERMLHWLRGYPSLREIEDTSFITGPGLGAQSGVKGALAMAIAMCLPQGGEREPSIE
jgi:fructokinase